MEIALIPLLLSLQRLRKDKGRRSKGQELHLSLSLLAKGREMCRHSRTAGLDNSQDFTTDLMILSFAVPAFASKISAQLFP